MALKILAGELLGAGSSPSERFIDMKTYMYRKPSTSDI